MCRRRVTQTSGSRAGPVHRLEGFTIVELLIVVAIVAILASIALPYYRSSVEQARLTRARGELRHISTEIEMFRIRNGIYPGGKNPGGLDGQDQPNIGLLLGLRAYTDPWGRDYRYLNIKAQDDMAMARKDMNLVPINTYFDLYSIGPDGLTKPPVALPPSRDDVIYANDGDFIDVARNY